MTTSPDPAAQDKTLLETGKDYLDSAVRTAKEHPAATAGIAAGVAAAAAGAVYGATKLKERNASGGGSKSSSSKSSGNGKSSS